MAPLERVGLEDMLLEAVSGQFADWWWLIALAATVFVLRAFTPREHSRRRRRKGYPEKTGRRQRRATSRKLAVVHPLHSQRVKEPSNWITGKAYVTDGDGIRVANQEVRLIGLDAPEWDQYAQHQKGYWFNHGKKVKNALIREIGGEHVDVFVEGTDRFGRLLGTVTHNGRDVGEWLVREGHAIAAYSGRYKRIEREGGA